MDIHLKNYNENDFELFVYKHTNQSELIKLTGSRNFNFIQAINLLKVNQTLSPHEKYKVSVNFENFSYFRELIFNTKKTIHNFFNKIKLTSNNYPESSWSVDFKNSIHITNTIYSTKTSFTEYLNKKLTANEVLIYTFLHELGHAIHSELKYNSNLNFSSKNVIQPNIQKFLNDSISFKDLNSLNTNNHSSTIQAELEKDLNLLSHQGMKEGFADLYACIAISLIYPKQQALNIINTAIEGRNYSDTWNKEFYHSKESLQQFLTDFQNNNIKFNNFIDLQNYIEKTTSNTIMTKFTEQINNKTDNDIFVNHYFGVLKNKLKLQSCNSLSDMINYINKTYVLNLQQRNQNEFFDIGFKSSYKSSPNPKISNINNTENIKNNIFSLRKQYTQQEHSITSKNKI